MSASDSRSQPYRDPESTGDNLGSDGRRREMEPTRELRLPEDAPLMIGENEAPGAGEDYEILFLEPTGGWALLLPDGEVLHGHGPTGLEQDEEAFFQCESKTGPGGETMVQCTECGALISEERIEQLIDQLDNSLSDEE